MPIDRYTPCPGGTGKKIKFCCHDLLHELDGVQRMLEGAQRLACLEHVQKLLEKFPDRACLLSIKALLQAEMGQTEALVSTLDHFQATHPGNPVALSERAIHLAVAEDSAAAIGPLHQALESIEEQMPTRLYDALGIVGQALLGDGHIMAAQAHLLLQAAIGGSEDPRAMQLLMPIMRSPNVPVLLKEDWSLASAPGDAPWKAAFDEASHLAMRGAWQGAAERFEQLRNKIGDVPPLMRNLALLYSWLARNNDAAAAWRLYAAAQDVPLEDAVEAEAIAQMIDETEPDHIDLVDVIYPIVDFEALMARLAADGRTERLPEGAPAPNQEGEPPPQAAFMLLDRAMPRTGVGIRREDIPCSIGQCYLFGRETDREARLEFVVYRDANFQRAKDTLAELAGDGLGAAGEEKVLTQITRLQAALTWRWRLPRDTPPDDRQRLETEQRRVTILEIWPGVPNPRLDGRSPNEVASDEAYRVRLLAAILVLSAGQPSSDFDFNQLRSKLQLPALDTIDPKTTDPADLPLTRLHRVDASSMTDEQLIDAYQRSAMMHAAAALCHLAGEVVRRPALKETVDMQEAYGLLARLARNTDDALANIERARQEAVAAGDSPARWLMAELELRLVRAEVAESQRLFRMLQQHHINEPGVAQALYELLARMGLVAPDGSMVGGRDADAAASAELPETAAAAQPGGIWTPGSEPSAPAKKSAIWTPDS